MTAMVTVDVAGAQMGGAARLAGELHSYLARTGLESFGYPLAEARVLGRPVIARNTAQNKEIAGPALRGFDPADPGTLHDAVQAALTDAVTPDPAPFDPDAYFDWMLGDGQ